MSSFLWFSGDKQKKRGINNTMMHTSAEVKVSLLVAVATNTISLPSRSPELVHIKYMINIHILPQPQICMGYVDTIRNNTQGYREIL